VLFVIAELVTLVHLLSFTRWWRFSHVLYSPADAKSAGEGGKQDKAIFLLCQKRHEIQSLASGGLFEP